MASERSTADPRRQKLSRPMKRIGDAVKIPDGLYQDFERFLIAEAALPVERRQDVIHPSEMSHSDWCPRSTYLRIRAARDGRLEQEIANPFQLENIFEEGHNYHHKWQGRLRRMGRLHGMWKCEACRWVWRDTSPVQCPECDALGGALTYLEVPLADSEFLISGSADGEVVPGDTSQPRQLVEIKSVGEGTLRQELPEVLGANTYEVEDHTFRSTKKILDHRGVWKGINMPFSPHLKQGWIYLRLRGLQDDAVTQISYIYEYKPTSSVKIFVVKRKDSAVDKLWEAADDICYALETGKSIPRCIAGVRAPCKQCAVYEGI